MTDFFLKLKIKKNGKISLNILVFFHKNLVSYEHTGFQLIHTKINVYLTVGNLIETKNKEKNTFKRSSLCINFLQQNKLQNDFSAVAKSSVSSHSITEDLFKYRKSHKALLQTYEILQKERTKN